jgi:hypothetical protein
MAKLEHDAPHVPQRGDFGLTKGTGWAMLAIRWGTLSRYGHACICVGEPTEAGLIPIVEAMPEGVRKRLVYPHEDWDWSRSPLTEVQRLSSAVLAEGEVGERYDWPAIAGFITRRLGWKYLGRNAKDHPDDKEMCSELVAWVRREVGAEMYPGVAPRVLSPGDLAQYEMSH